MDAIVLVGGQGTRLRPLTLTRHKSLVPVLNRPAFDYLLDWLRASGVDRAVLALGQGNADLAESYPEGDRDGLRIHHVIEKERLESGGAIRNAVAEAAIDGRFLVLNGDIFLQFPLADAVAAHEERQADLTLGLFAVEDPSSFGVAVIDEHDHIAGFVEKPPRGTAQSNLVNAGVWIFEPHLVDEIPAGPVRVEDTLFPSLVARDRPVFGYRIDGLWADLGTPERYLELHWSLLAGHEPTPAGASMDHTVCAPDSTVDPTASIAWSAIGPGCRLESEVELRESILWEGVHLARGAIVEGSVLADGVSVEQGAVVRDAVLGQGAIVPAGLEVPPGTRLKPGERYHESHG